jgi:hypothetical protein
MRVNRHIDETNHIVTVLLTCDINEGTTAANRADALRQDQFSATAASWDGFSFAERM